MTRVPKNLAEVMLAKSNRLRQDSLDDLGFLGGEEREHPMAKARISPEKMNGEECAYAVYLMEERACSRVIDWRFQPFKLNLAPATTYTPDFMVVLADRTIEFVEVKAWWKPSKKALQANPNAKGRVGWMEDARAKTKIAASMFPWFKFVATWRRDGNWEREEIPA